MPLQLLDLPSEVINHILLLSLQLSEDERVGQIEHEEENKILTELLGGWSHRGAWDIVVKYARQGMAKNFTNREAVDTAAALRLVSKNLADHLDFPLRRFPHLVQEPELPTSCRHYVTPAWAIWTDPPHIPSFSETQDSSFPPPEWCLRCIVLQRYNAIAHTARNEYTRHLNELERLSLFHYAWTVIKPPAPIYFHIKPALAATLLAELPRDSVWIARSRSRIPLQAATSVRDFIQAATSGFTVPGHTRYWRYCDRLRRLDTVSDPSAAAHLDIHTPDASAYGHRILDMHTTYWPSSDDALNMHAPAPYMRHHVSICCASGDRDFGVDATQAKYLPANADWRDPDCSRNYDDDGNAYCDSNVCPVTWRDDARCRDRGVANDLAGGYDVQMAAEAAAVLS